MGEEVGEGEEEEGGQRGEVEQEKAAMEDREEGEIGEEKVQRGKKGGGSREGRWSRR